MPEGPGRLIAGQYRLVEQVGRGGFAVVWRARDERLHRDVAAKRLFLPPHFTGEQRAERRELTLREARSAARLAHRGIVTVHDVVEDVVEDVAGEAEDGDASVPWIIMEFIRGRSLRDLVEAHGPLAPERVAEIGGQVLDALRAAHRAGVLHRDVKPGNILIADRGAVLGDFGLATVDGDPGLTGSGLVMGAPAFTAPERARGEPAVPASDLWSLGATLFHAVEGHRPFAGANPNAVFHAILTREPAPVTRAGSLAPVIEGLLRKNVADRLTAGAAARLLAEAAMPGRAPAPPRPGHRPPARAASGSRSGHRVVSGALRVTSLLVAPAVAVALALLAVPSAPERTDDVARRSTRAPGGAAPALVAVLPAGTGAILTVAFSPDGRTLAAGGADHVVRLWNVPDRRLVTVLTGHAYDVSSVAFGPRGRMLAGAGDDGRVLLWSGTRHRRVAALDAGGAVGAVSFSADGRTLATAGDAVRLWDVASHRSAGTLPDRGEGLVTAAFAPRGRSLATGGTQALRIWNTGRFAGSGRTGSGRTGGSRSGGSGRSGDEERPGNSGRPARPATLARPSVRVRSLAFSPDGGTLAAAGDDGRVRVWGVRGRRPPATLPGPRGRVTAVAFSRDGRTLASAGGRDVLLWHAATGTPAGALTIPDGTVDAIAFGPGGMLATAGDDATVRLWRLA